MLALENFFEKPGSTTCLLLPVSRNQFVIWLVFEQASLGITSFNMIVELGSLNIITYSVNNEVTKFIKIVYRSKEVEGTVEIRTRQYHEIKTKRMLVILFDPENLSTLNEQISQLNIRCIL